MAATQISDDLLECHVKQGIDRWRQGDLFIAMGVGEGDEILEAGASIPEKNDKSHPFNKFLEEVASDIAQHFLLERSEKKSIYRRLQSKSDKWKELVAPKSEQMKAPTPKKQKIKKEYHPPEPEADLLESPQILDEQMPDPIRPTIKEEPLDTRLAAKKRLFEEARDEILVGVPDDVKARFGQIYFSKWGKFNLPVLVMSPYSVPPGEVRDTWLKMYYKTSSQGRTSYMTHLV